MIEGKKTLFEMKPRTALALLLWYIVSIVHCEFSEMERAAFSCNFHGTVYLPPTRHHFCRRNSQVKFVQKVKFKYQRKIPKMLCGYHKKICGRAAGIRREERDVVLGEAVVCRQVCLLFCAVQRIPIRLLLQCFPDCTKMVMMMYGAWALSACAKRSV